MVAYFRKTNPGCRLPRVVDRLAAPFHGYLAFRDALLLLEAP